MASQSSPRGAGGAAGDDLCSHHEESAALPATPPSRINASALEITAAVAN